MNLDAACNNLSLLLASVTILWVLLSHRSDDSMTVPESDRANLMLKELFTLEQAVMENSPQDYQSLRLSEDTKILSGNTWFGLISIETVERLYPYPECMK